MTVSLRGHDNSNYG